MTDKDPTALTRRTLNYYESRPGDFWEGTKDHDVSQNYENFLGAIDGEGPFNILDLGCGPGRDLKYFSDLGHHSYGLDGCEAFCRMANKYTGCNVYHQDFLSLELPESFFHGIFANASLFHVPKIKLPNVLRDLYEAILPSGILFSSNPRGSGERTDEPRYCNFMELPEYQKTVESVGFKLLHHYYRPQGLPLAEQPWLACVFQKPPNIISSF